MTFVEVIKLKVRLLAWPEIQYDGVLTKQKKFRQKNAHKGKMDTYESKREA